MAKKRVKLANSYIDNTMSWVKRDKMFFKRIFFKLGTPQPLLMPDL